MERVEKAVALKGSGYNCAQAVVCAFADVAGVEEEVLFRIAAGFGSGMGDTQNVCGAVAGAVMVNGLLNSAGTPGNMDARRRTMECSRQIVGAFREKNGSVVCRELKGIETGTVLRSCSGCVADAAELAEKLLLEQKG